MASDKSSDGFKREGEHREGCVAAADKDGVVFVVSDRERPLRFDLKRNGHRGGSTMWWNFACNDIQCEARLLVRWDVLAAFVNRGRTGEQPPT